MIQEKSDVVVPYKDEIRIFPNDNKLISIAVRDCYGEESLVQIDPKDVSAICKALRSAAREMRQ